MHSQRPTTHDSLDWAVNETAEPEPDPLWDAVESATLRRLDTLYAEAVALATDCMDALLQAREAHPYHARGSVGVRVRRSPSPRSAPGVFLIEWFRVRGQQRTDYIARGSGHRYARRTFGRLEPWEWALIETYEPRFAEIRLLLHQIGLLRRQARHLTVLLERRERSDSGLEFELQD